MDCFRGLRPIMDLVVQIHSTGVSEVSQEVNLLRRHLGFRRAILWRYIGPTQAITIDEDYPAQGPLVVHTEIAMRLRKKDSSWPSAYRSASKGRSFHHSIFEAVNHAMRRKSMHPDPKNI